MSGADRTLTAWPVDKSPRHSSPISETTPEAILARSGGPDPRSGPAAELSAHGSTP